eukprot:m.112895 g.112895  ORF g.112895 m.112895 type:complete len:889 (+) comp15424_c0_seq1:120-2786(+)
MSEPDSPLRSSSPPAYNSDAPEPFPDETEALERDDADSVRMDEEEGEGEELFGDNMAADYRPIAQLDTYEGQDLDDNSELSEMDPATRAAIEAQMAARDQRESMRVRGRSRMPAGLGFGDDEGEEDGEDVGLSGRRRRLAERAARVDADGDEDMDENTPIIENLEDKKGHSTRAWVQMESTRREIYRRLRIFLKTTTVDDRLIYIHKIREMAQSNQESLIVDYGLLCQHQPAVSMYLADCPSEIFQIFDAAAKDVVLELFPSYEDIKPEIHVRLAGMPLVEEIRNLRQSVLNKLIAVRGVVTRRTGVFPQLKVVKYNCEKCSYVIGPIVQDDVTEVSVNNCPNCQSRGPFSINAEETIYRNYQRITIQESPGSVPAGRLPRQKDVILLWDYVDFIKPGDEITLTGIYRNNFDRALNTKHGFPVFATVIEANYIEKTADKFYQDGITDDDKAAIKKLAQDENIGQKIFRAIAPSIYGHEDIKEAIALAMFGGQAKNPGGKHRVRGDINVLILGDPGTAKSQFLKYVEKTAHRAVFTTGQGASAVGLTASVSRDPVTREWTLQGGALVLADQGVCLIDEFDKMNDQDRTSIHEAMEQQSISVSKAGIVTSLQARCSVIAAANPIRGRYQPGSTFSSNVDLTEPILSRFDILCVVKDTVDISKDERLANFVVNSHAANHPNAEQTKEDTSEKTTGISQEMLRKYIMYSKQNVRPKLQDMDQDKIANLYSELRREAEITGSIPITVRHIESMIRIAEAHARMHLRDYVRADDVDMAISVTLRSFIATQKHSVAKTMARSFQKYLNHGRDSEELLRFVLEQLVQETALYEQSRTGEEEQDELHVDLEEFRLRAKALQIHDLTSFFASSIFTDQGSEYEVREQDKVIIKTFERN